MIGRRWRLAAVWAVWAVVLASWTLSARAEVIVRDDRGATIRLAAPPQRVVSLLPSLTETLCALGFCERLVGIDRYSNWPASVPALPKLGGMDDTQVERLVALRPDVVLAARSTRAVERLESLGLVVVVLEPRSQAEAKRTVATIATLMGRPEQGAMLWARIDQQVQRAAARVPAALRGQKVYFEVDSAPYAAGSTSFLGELLTQLGLGNIVPPALGPFPKLNPEFIVKAQPDLVMAVERNLRDMPRRPGWATLKALQTGRTCAFEASRYEMLVRPGPRLGEAADLVADCLQALR
ncbi:helical backbone metal receptor [Sphaerotilus sp.]|uniref:ABC transporter substrate-binding protein n=1 Tax=Sphaerotilus sp. TaxID=2093942 RepID=UPI002ACD5CEB|nr:helical backbone metal receptor [Sphaerotilus sp.]MDZ7856241.1 helical backbone metal receptor [Sphaerotilus sp.]